MTYFPDLAPCTYLHHTEPTKAVGWLALGQEFPVGEVPREFQSKLLSLYRDHQSHFTRGWHSCPFCPNPYVAKVHPASCDAEIVVEYTGVVYRAPALILHYVLAHRYQPPPEFIAAVLNGTPVDDPSFQRHVEQVGVTGEQVWPE